VLPSHVPVDALGTASRKSPECCDEAARSRPWLTGDCLAHISASDLVMDYRTLVIALCRWIVDKLYEGIEGVLRISAYQCMLGP